MGCSDETAMQQSTTQEPVFHEHYMHVTKCVQHCWTAGVQYAQVSNLSVCFLSLNHKWYGLDLYTNILLHMMTNFVALYGIESATSLRSQILLVLCLNFSGACILFDRVLSQGDPFHSIFILSETDHPSRVNN